MTDNLLSLAGGFLLLAAIAVTSLLVIGAMQVLRRRDRQAAENQMIEVARLQAETGVRIEAMRDMLAGRQA
jgi:hypothetical protein